MRLPSVELARPADAISTADHFVPVRDPANGAANGKDHREHGGWDAQGLQNDARIEIHIGIELFLDEILVLKRYFLEPLGDFKIFIFDAQFG